ncbi:hypothetical protein BD413DRAFT_136493 [Trametes elegans]|nr:hypothetical protein BD413DRAFT_136493 [Trametes elegans]
MLTLRSVAHGLLLLSAHAALLSSAHARQDSDVAIAAPNPPPALVVRQFPPALGGGHQATTDTDTAATTGAATGATTAAATTANTAATGATTAAGTTQEQHTIFTGSAIDNFSTVLTGVTSPTTESTSTTPTTSADTSTTTSATTTGAQTTSSQTPTQAPSVTQSVSTNAAGQEVTVEVTATVSQTSSSTSSSQSSAADQSGDDKKDDGISKSTIIGLSVSGGIALIGIITFVVWKFTRKRFGDDDFDSESRPHTSHSLFPEPESPDASSLAPLPRGCTGRRRRACAAPEFAGGAA